MLSFYFLYDISFIYLNIYENLSFSFFVQLSVDIGSLKVI